MQFVDRLENSNNNFKEAFSARIQESSAIVKAEARMARTELLELYVKFATYVEIMVNVSSTEEFELVFTLVNTVRKYFADMLARREGIAAEGEAAPVA